MSSTDPLTVYVYGHYDSRGGTTALATESKEKADTIYNNELFSWDSMIEGYKKNPSAWTWNSEKEIDSWPCNVDYLYTAQLLNAPDGSDIDLENYGGMCDEVGGEVWIDNHSDSEFTEPTDRIVQLMWVPVEYYEGDMHQVPRGWASAEATDMLTRGMPEGGKIVIEGDAAVLYYTEPKQMIRCAVDGVVYKFDSNTSGRVSGWSHPRWDDDAYSFVLMRR